MDVIFHIASQSFMTTLKKRLLRVDEGSCSCETCLKTFTRYHLHEIATFSHLHRCACTCTCYTGDETNCCSDLNKKTIHEIARLRGDDLYRLMNVKHMKVLFTAACGTYFKNYASILPITKRKHLSNPTMWIHEYIKIKTFLNSSSCPSSAVITKHDAYHPLRKLSARYAHLDMDFVWVVKNDDVYYIFDAFCQKIYPPTQTFNMFLVEDGAPFFSAIGAIAARESQVGGRLQPLRAAAASSGQLSKYEYVFLLHSVVSYSGSDHPPIFKHAFPLTVDQLAQNAEQSPHLSQHLSVSVPGVRRVRMPGFLQGGTLILLRYNLRTSQFDIVTRVDADRLCLDKKLKAPNSISNRFAKCRNRRMFVDFTGCDEDVSPYDVYIDEIKKGIILAVPRSLINIVDDSVVLF